MLGCSRQGKEKIMTRVRLLRGGRVTLPVDIRQKLKVTQGDYLEAEVVESGVLLKPALDITREEAWEELIRIIDEPKRRAPSTMSPEEEEEWIAEEIKAARIEEHAKSRR
jgi:bifunctional DNA-binding transcriptional regulator/antitoxin component of YhaV-PrlF toxin-antitoxin module